MTDTTDLMKGHHIATEVVSNGHGKLVKRQVLFFRADKVIVLLQERNAHLQEISNRLAQVVEKHKARKAELDAAYAELHKIWGGHHVLFDRDVYERVQAWWAAKEKADGTGT